MTAMAANSPCFLLGRSDCEDAKLRCGCNRLSGLDESATERGYAPPLLRGRRVRLAAVARLGRGASPADASGFTKASRSFMPAPVPCGVTPSSSSGAFWRLSQNVVKPNHVAPATSQPFDETKTMSLGSTPKAWVPSAYAT